jgi:phosphoribosylformylglycinamidine synthase
MIAAGQAGVSVTSVGRFTGSDVRIGNAEAPLEELSAIFRSSFEQAIA